MEYIALIYCRVSSMRQKKEGHGLESQEHRCRAFASNNNFPIEKVFGDSISGAGDYLRRPAMRELLEHIDKNPHKQYVVIFDDIKRLARDTIEHWKLRREFQKRNIEIRCLNYNFGVEPEDEFIETILAAQGQLERKQNRRQVIQKQKARLERGYWPFYPPPGYKHAKDPVHGKLLTPTEPRAGIIREALEGFSTCHLCTVSQKMFMKRR